MSLLLCDTQETILTCENTINYDRAVLYMTLPLSIVTRVFLRKNSAKEVRLYETIIYIYTITLKVA